MSIINSGCRAAFTFTSSNCTLTGLAAPLPRCCWAVRQWLSLVTMDGVLAAETPQPSHQELYQDYMNVYLTRCSEARPCRDPSLLDKAGRYIEREPRPRGTTLLPVYQALSQSRDNRKVLSAFITAAELLETVCLNLFLQPWRKEIKTLKTFTGPFVYHLLPVLSISTIDSFLASIGYLPHNDSLKSEYRLTKDVNPDKAMQQGFELFLTRVECYHLLEVLTKDQVGAQELLEVLQRGRVGPPNSEASREKITATEEDKGETYGKEVLPQALRSNHEPPRCHLLSMDQSILQMQTTYPDLVFRGRPLLSDKPHRAKRSRVTRRGCNPAELQKVESATTQGHEIDGSRVAAVPAEDDRGGDSTDRNRDGAAAPSGATSNVNGVKAEEEPSHPQALSLHITLRAAPTAELQMDEEQEQSELAERLGQLNLKDTKEGVKIKEERKRGE